MNYNFHDQMEWKPFQNMVRDLIQKRDGVTFESFKDGKDSGMDGRCLNEGKLIVFQSKRVDMTAARLKYMLEKQELPKVEKLNPDRYILALSMNLSQQTKNRILEIFEGYIKAPSDLITRDDLNNLLSQYPDVEEKYGLLLESGTFMPRRLLKEEIHRETLQRSQWALQKALEIRVSFVETKAYREALNRAIHCHSVIISGEPGAGKTTSALMIALHFLNNLGFEEFYMLDNLNDIFKHKREDKKQIFLYDDFWGSIAPNAGLKDVDQLAELIRNTHKNLNRIILFTTREYIYQQWIDRNSQWKELLDKEKITHFTQDYSSAEKAEIFISHLNHSNLKWRYVKYFYDRTDRVVAHSNYNPRVIGLFFGDDSPISTGPKEYFESFIQFLNYPLRFWETAFGYLSKEAKYICLLLFISGGRMINKNLQKSFDMFRRLHRSLFEKPKDYNRCIAELEKSFVITYQHDNAELILVDFQIPAVSDFFKEYLNENMAVYGDDLVSGSLYFNQLTFFLFDEDTTCFEAALGRCLEELDELPVSTLGDADVGESFFLLNVPEKYRLYKIFRLMDVFEQSPSSRLFDYLEAAVKDVSEAILQGEMFSYYDYMKIPQLLSRGAALGILPDKREIVLEEYFKRCILIEHFVEVKYLCNKWADEYGRHLSEKLETFTDRLENTIVGTIYFLENSGREEELQYLLQYRLIDIFSTFDCPYTVSFYNELKEVVGAEMDILHPEQEEKWETFLEPAYAEGDNEKDYRQTVEKAGRWLLGERYSLNNDSNRKEDNDAGSADGVCKDSLAEDEIDTFTEGLEFSVQQKKQLQECWDTWEPWHLMEFILDRNLLKLLEESFCERAYIPEDPIALFDGVWEFMLSKLSFSEDVVKSVVWDWFDSGVLEWKDSIDQSDLDTIISKYELTLEKDILLDELLDAGILVYHGKWLKTGDPLLLFYQVLKMAFSSGQLEIPGRKALYERLIRIEDEEIRNLSIRLLLVMDEEHFIEYCTDLVKEEIIERMESGLDFRKSLTEEDRIYEGLTDLLELTLEHTTDGSDYLSHRRLTVLTVLEAFDLFDPYEIFPYTYGEIERRMPGLIANIKEDLYYVSGGEHIDEFAIGPGDIEGHDEKMDAYIREQLLNLYDTLVNLEVIMRNQR